MWQQLIARAERTLRSFLAVAGPRLIAWTRTVAAFMAGPFLTAARAAIQVIAALVLLFAEWGWEPLVDALSRLTKYFVFARLEAWIKTLPPYGALALFAAPALCLVPIKLLALFLFATGHAASGVLLIIAAKVAGTAVVARIYMLVKPQLMTIAWFKDGYDRFIPWKERMFAEIRASEAWRTGRLVRVDVKRAINRGWIAMKPQRAWAVARLAALREEIRSLIAAVGKSRS